MFCQNLSYFLVLYDVRNITKAADRLYISRQALSDSIRKLEAEVEVPLFVREKSGVVPTTAADEVWRFGVAATQQWEEVLRSIRLNKGQTHVTFGVDMSNIPELVITAVSEYEDAHPGTSIQIEQYGDQKQLLHDLLGGEVSVAALINAPEIDGMTRHHILDSNLYCLFGKNNKLSQKDVIDFFVDLKGANIICSPDYVYDELEPYAARAGCTLSRVQRNLPFAKEALIRGNSVLFIPSHTVEAMTSKSLVARPCTHMPWRVDGYLCHLSTAEINVVSDFAGYLATVYRSLQVPQGASRTSASRTSQNGRDVH